MNRIKTWPHLVIIGLIFLAVGVGAAVLWSRHEQTAEAAALPNAARLERVNGEVGLNRALNGSGDTQWVSAEQNAPLSVGDRIYTKDNADASVAFSGRNFARLNANTSLDVLALSDEKTQVAMRDGSGVFDIGNLPSGDLFEVATPCGAVDLMEPGLYQIEINDSGNATATVLNGSAQVMGQGGTSRIEKSEVLSVPCQGDAAATRTRVEPRAAGTFVDHYYRDRYPRIYDGRYANYDSYLSDPSYYDPSRRFASYQYVSDDIPGVDYLDDYGDWQDVGGYGECWHPRVDSGWAPYQSGYWTTDYPYGLTWISNEPWGYAPYHYGRWTFISNQWFWVPERVRTRPVYAPALVAFIPFAQTETIGWVPLGPGDPYAARYYDSNWTPRYLSRRGFSERVINLNVPGAVTVVNVREFNHVIDPRRLERFDAQRFAHVRPVLDPFSDRSLRDVALRTHEGQRQFDVPARLAQRFDRPVISSTTPVAPFRKDLAQRFHVQSLPDQARSKRLASNDGRAGNAGAQPAPAMPVTGQPNQAAEQARERQMANLSREAARGDRGARAQMQQLQRQQQQQQREQNAVQQRNARMAEQQAQGERVRNDVQPRAGVGQQRVQQQPGNQPAPRANRERPFMRTPQANRQSPPVQSNQPRQVQRQPQPQMSNRGRNIGPPLRQAQPQPRPVQPPRAMREQRPVQMQPRPQQQPQPRMRQPQPQAQPRPAPVRQPQPQAQPRPAPVRQPHPQAQPQNDRRRPPQPAAASGSQPQNGKRKPQP
jgi:FecR protein